MAMVGILGVPTDSNSSFLRGPAKAPAAIRAALASPSGNSFTEAELDLSAAGVMFDAGDVPVEESPADLGLIERAIATLLERGDRVVSLGGDHSITYPIVRAYAAAFPGLSLVHFDAHPDLYPDFEGNPLSHASPFARILESTPIRRLVQIGIRTMSAKQRAVVERYGVAAFAPDRLAEAVAALPDGPVYVTIDMDTLDPAFAPGVSHREPGGLTVREVLGVIARIPGRVVGADVVELNPDEDFRGNTATVAAKFAKELIGRIWTDAEAEARV